MFSDHKRSKLKLNDKMLPGKFLNLEINKHFLKITVETEEITREI